MVAASQLRTGMAIRFEGNPYKVVACEYHPGQGKMGGAISLEGDGYVDLNAHAKRFATLQRGTIALWFKMTKASSGYAFVSLSSGHLSNVLLLGGKGTKPWFELKHGNTSAYWGNFRAKYETERWHHVAFVVAGDGLCGYLDGRNISLHQF